MVGLRGESGYGVVERESLAMEPLAEFVFRIGDHVLGRATRED